MHVMLIGKHHLSFIMYWLIEIEYLFSASCSLGRKRRKQNETGRDDLDLSYEALDQVFTCSNLYFHGITCWNFSSRCHIYFTIMFSPVVSCHMLLLHVVTCFHMRIYVKFMNGFSVGVHSPQNVWMINNVPGCHTFLNLLFIRWDRFSERERRLNDMIAIRYAGTPGLPSVLLPR